MDGSGSRKFDLGTELMFEDMIDQLRELGHKSPEACTWEQFNRILICRKSREYEFNGDTIHDNFQKTEAGN